MSYLPIILAAPTFFRCKHLQQFGLLFLFLIVGFNATLRAEAPVTHMPGDTIIEASICSNETYDFNGELLDQAGTYEVVLTASDGSDSTVTLILSVLPTSSNAVEAEICDDETYAFNGANLNMSGIYVAIFPAFNGCDSTVTLSLIVLPVAKTDLNVTICGGESYNFGGTDLFNPGVYTEIYTAFNGCDSVVTLFLEVLPTSQTNLRIGICIGSFYTFDGQQLTQSGIYTAVYPAFNGCDSTVVLTLEVVAFFDIKLKESICEGETYTFGDTIVALPGVYVDSLKAFGGCDSTVTVALSVFPHLSTALNIDICTGDLYVFGTDTLSAPGVYVDSLSTINGCDSVVTLTLSTLPIFSTSIEATICANETYDFNGDTLSDEGVYTQILAAENGCDSTVRLTLSVRDLSQTALEASICDGSDYDFNGDLLTEAGTYTQTYTAFNSCDSVVNLTLTVLPLSVTNLLASICEGETFVINGETLNTAGNYTYLFTAANGCDSTVALALSVLPVSETALEGVFCAGGFYPFNGELLTDAGTYTAVLEAFNGCDSTVTLTLIELPNAATAIAATICANNTYDFNGDLLDETGTYTVVLPAFNGCDSTVTLNLTVLPLAETNLALTLCDGTSTEFNGETLTLAGVYTSVLEAFNGCDSTVTLTLNFVPFFAQTITAAICEGETFTFDGNELTQSGTYTQALFAVGGCDSTLTLVLTVNPVFALDVAAAICDGDTYTFDGVDLDQAGSYTAVFQSVDGCDSTVNLSLTVLPVSASSVEITICDGETYDFNGQVVFEAGMYNAVLPAANGCDSTVSLTLNVLPISETLLQSTICAGDVYDFNGADLTEAGVYIDVLVAFNGCDSVVALQLIVLPQSSSSITAQICQGTSYTFDGLQLDQSGTYTAIYTGANGCDSTVTLVLSVDEKLISSEDAVICGGDTYLFDGQELDVSGTYSVIYTAIGGCDSIVTLNLTVLPKDATSLNIILCAGDSYPFNGEILEQTGIYTAGFTNVNGCDSTVTLNLTVLPGLSSAFDASTCNGDPFEYGGSVLNQTGSYQFVFTAANGCDSMVTVNLTIYQDVPPTVLVVSICQGESYSFFGQNLTISGAYTEILATVAGCDSLIGLLLTVLPNKITTLNQSLCEGDSTFFNGSFVTAPGVYSAVYPAANGCDSTVTLNLLVTPVNNSVTLSGNTLTATAQNAIYLWINCSTGLPVPNAIGQSFTPEATGQYAVFVTQNGCSRLSNCIQVIGTSTNEPENGIVWQLAPNPAVSETNIRFEQPLNSDCTVELVDASGKILRTEHVSQGTTFVSLELTNMPDGMLFVRLNDGQNVVVKRLVKASR